MTRIAAALMWVLHFLPLGVLAPLGGALGTALFWLLPERRRVTRINLEKCFPALDPAARERLAREHFRAFGRSFLEHAILWWGSRERIARMVQVKGLEHLRALSGCPVLLVAPHFVGLDAVATRLASEGSFVGIYSRQKDPVLAQLLERGRTRFGEQIALSRQQGVRRAISEMKNGRPFFYLPDQDYGPRDSIFVPFFGVAAATVPGVSRIARVGGAKVLPCVARMLPGGAGYIVRIGPPWENFPTADVEADTRRVNAFIEERVREMPEQYLWMHKRFKTRPPGEARFY